jgi:hypothetical protein
VVLRNLPPSANAELIYKNFGTSSSRDFKIINVEKPQMVKGQMCAIIQFGDINQAENFCKRKHNFSFNDVKFLKAHIHPLSST